MKLEFSQQMLEKYSDIKFHENSFSGRRVVAYGRTDRRINITKLIVAFRDLENVSKNVKAENIDQKQSDS
jgi:hypothetical protein